METIAGFEQLTTSLKQKWLEFFQLNRSWLTRYMEVEPVHTPDGGRRPPSYLILGVVNALEPQLRDLMLPFSKLNPDVDALIEVLELNFDPDLVLGNHFNPALDLDVLRDVFLESDEEESSEVSGSSLEQSSKLLSATEADVLAELSLDEIVEAIALPESDKDSLEMRPVVRLKANFPTQDKRETTIDMDEATRLEAANFPVADQKETPAAMEKPSANYQAISRLFPI